MKVLLLMIAMVISTSALAGLPENDRVVAELRQRFRDGHAPNAYQLTSTRYLSTQYSAMADSFGGSSDIERFSYEPATNSFRDQWGVILTMNAQELIGAQSYRNCLYFDAYRADNEGNIILERSRDHRNSMMTLEPISDYARNNGAKVSSYTIYTPKY